MASMNNGLRGMGDGSTGAGEWRRIRRLTKERLAKRAALWRMGERGWTWRRPPLWCNRCQERRDRDEDEWTGGESPYLSRRKDEQEQKGNEGGMGPQFFLRKKAEVANGIIRGVFKSKERLRD
ncbi:hypothetical protein E2562_009844 [Oryza meyeriana var. granulata]|uniref:Uncharacterized protein n=1 Tax=Oryza meyeriana var. granulata TaxID=110450 RepID=A0A6G1BUJ1_9ORYZ|nr:hypothetical protein E2562_009844 [Oryza meyeriana var. granulata]